VSTELDRALAETIAELAGRSRPSDLMPGVRIRARRNRMRRRAGWAAGALGVILLLVVPLLVVGRSDRTEPAQRLTPSPAVPSGSPAPAPSWPATLDATVTLPGGWTVGASTYRNASGGGGQRQSWVYDRPRQRYVQINYQQVWPAPRGSLVAVVNGDGSSVGVLDLNTGTVRWLDGQLSSPEWSPDGTRLLVTLKDSSSGGGYAVVDGSTGAVHQHQVNTTQTYVCTGDCHFSWYPDGKQVVLAQADRTVPPDGTQPDPQGAVQLFDADTGQARSALPVRGVVAGWPDWSPDRKWVFILGTVTENGHRQQRAQLFNVATGKVDDAVPGQPGAAAWSANDQVLLASDGRVCPFRLDHNQGDCVQLPDQLAAGEDGLILLTRR
jgi:hypothetical protein